MGGERISTSAELSQGAQFSGGHLSVIDKYQELKYAFNYRF